MSSSRQKGGRHLAKYHGLLNQGATCYLNSVLQVLFMTKDFREAVESYSCDNDCMDRRLKRLFDKLRTGKTNTLDITKILCIKKVHEQHDAAECFEKILTYLTCAHASNIFQGRLTHENTCSSCSNKSVTNGPFWSLPLELVKSQEKTYTVVEGISKYFTALAVSGSNQIYCDECAAKSDATNEFVINEHPEVLTLLLKRFKFDDRRMEHVKINCSVEVPYTLQIPESQTYDLYAFVDHFGDLRGGHYTATIKSQEDERWYNFNDTTVTPLRYPPFQVHDNKKRSQSAYLLFYRKKKMHAADALTQDTRDALTSKEEDCGKQRHEKIDRTGADGGKKAACTTKGVTSAQSYTSHHQQNQQQRQEKQIVGEVHGKTGGKRGKKKRQKTKRESR
ncbi:probable ubiquitin carboxyl-terminal hydrolase 5 [Seriola lalandi dorsalis]|uniref:probable ubiquitin carboxyl-terminal hydrolase 5 n=1 Tax=Seriola lalandi dorsalis TaxID=1841481 RepID=UPI000C6F67D3|nr:probable ubiquitin carboxyl-terminal hydrolase 5 [Seriola lalandi dorsalis]